MKKIIVVIVIIFGIIILSGLGYDFYKDWSLKNEINSYSDYYRQLAEDCKSKGFPGCCMSSVQYMQSGNFELSPEIGCHGGFQGNMLKCIDSYKWCEPIE